MKPLKKWLGERIVKARKEAGFGDQGEFAHILGTQQSTVSRWETGKFEPGPQFLSKIARVTGKPLAYFQPQDALVSPIPPAQMAEIQKIADKAREFNEEERAKIVSIVMNQLKETFVTQSLEVMKNEAFKFKNNPSLKALFDLASGMSDKELERLVEYARTLRHHRSPDAIEKDLDGLRSKPNHKKTRTR